jgi:hypothetical protein
MIPQVKEERAEPTKILLTSDRKLSVRPIDGKAPVSSTGLIDNRLFTGENTLHAIRDNTSLWSLRYDSGLVPEPLRRRFTSFQKLFDFAKTYFAKRNIEIKEVLD